MQKVNLKNFNVQHCVIDSLNCRLTLKLRLEPGHVSQFEYNDKLFPSRVTTSEARPPCIYSHSVHL